MKKLVNCPVCGSSHIKKVIEVKDYFLTREDFAIWMCDNCKLQFTNPRPESDELPAYYDSPEYLSHNAKGNGLTGKIYTAIRTRNIQFKYNIISRFISSGQILDIGCGTGELLQFFQQKNWGTAGVEPNATAREFANRQYHLGVKNVAALKDFPDHSYDVISMWHVLEHVPEIHQRIEEVKRLLKPEGILVIALPNYESWDAQHYKNFWAGWDVPRHLYHFSKTAFENLAQQHQLQVKEIFPLIYDAFYVSLLSARYRKTNFRLLTALVNGIRSNIAAKRNLNYSSLIYILQRDNLT
jgi:2-polyprenyl-3-methyl-5-hydroxy-6-metoxy-1,4-benzoquinol methylase